MYKLVAIDLDGTLLNDNKNISDRDIDVIRRVHNLGIRIVVATGRPLVVIKKILNQLDIVSDDNFCIALNGANVQKVYSDSMICSSVFSASYARMLVELQRKFDVYMHAFSTSYGLIANKKNKFSDIECYGGILDYSEFNFDLLKENDTFYKVVLTAEPNKIDILEHNLEQKFYAMFDVVRTLPCILEFLPKGTNKGSGLMRLANYLKIGRDQIIAIGDEHNDLEMLRFAGISVAMGNSVSAVSEIATMKTLSNNESGVAYALEKLILNSK